MEKICIGSDHCCYELKNKIINLLNNFGYEVKDLGSKEYLPDDDYPDTTKNVAEAISQGIYDKGIEPKAVVGENMDFDNIVSDNFVYRDHEAEVPKIEWKEPLKVEIDHFLDCINNNSNCKFFLN